LHLQPKTNKVCVKGSANFLPAALSIPITGGWRRSRHTTPIGANNATDVTEERMTSYTRQAIAAAILSVSFAVAQGVDLFETTPRFRVGDGPVAIVSCDLNEDGFPDVVTADQSFDDVAVLLSDQNGGFLPQIRFGVGAQPRGIECVDLNNDGHFDVVTFGNGSAILRGNGDGTFAVGLIGIGGWSAGAVGELTDDNIPDIVVTNPGGTALYVGNGGFTYTYKAVDNIGGTVVRVCELTGDKRNDILADVSVQGTDDAIIFKNLGNGTFVRFGGNGLCVQSEFALSDVDGDGKPDLLNPCGGLLRVKFGTALGAFSDEITLDFGVGVTSAAVADLNADNKPDILAISRGSNDIGIRLGLGNRMFQTVFYFGTGDDPRSLTVADFDGDTYVDIATSNFSSNDVSLLLGTGEGTFLWEPRFRVGGNPQSVVTCDLNLDGILDLATANSSTNDISVLVGRGNGRFAPEARYPAAERPIAIRCADVKEDGNPDLIVANQGSSEVSVYFGLGDGSFIAKPRFSTGPSPSDLVLCDVNEDDHIDVLTANSEAVGGVSVLIGQGNGFFLPETRSLSGVGGVYRVECAELDQDQHVDLVFVLTSSRSQLRTARGSGDGSFFDIGSPQQACNVSCGSVTDIVVGNIHGADIPDLASIKESSNGVDMFRGSGDGYFENLTGYLFPPNQIPRSVVIADVNRDTIPDLVVTNQNTDNLSVLLGRGEGTWDAQRMFGVGEDPYAVVTGDIDNDGDDDLITANSTSGSVSVLFNTAIEAPVLPGDRDGDGIVDAEDNCPDIANPNQGDFDGDKIGNACDPDLDNDGVPNGPDVCDYTPQGVPVNAEGRPLADLNLDCDVDLLDFAIFQNSMFGP